MICFCRARRSLWLTTVIRAEAERPGMPGEFQQLAHLRVEGIKAAEWWMTSLVTQRLIRYAGTMTPLCRASEQADTLGAKPRPLSSPEPASLLGGSGQGGLGSCLESSILLPEARAIPHPFVRGGASPSAIFAHYCPQAPGGTHLLICHQWSQHFSPQVPPQTPELGQLPTLHSTSFKQGSTHANYWPRLWGHKSVKTWLCQKEPRCGNKYGMGETRVGLASL